MLSLFTDGLLVLWGFPPHQILLHTKAGFKSVGANLCWLGKTDAHDGHNGSICCNNIFGSCWDAR